MVREAQSADELRQNRAQKFRCFLPFLMHDSIDIAILHDKVFRGYLLATREALRGLGGIPVRIERNLDGRSSVLARHIRLTLCQPLNQKSRAARRSHRPDRRKRNALLPECLFGFLRKFFEDTRHDMCGNLFCSYFKQQILAHAFFPLFNIGYPSSSRCFR